MARQGRATFTRESAERIARAVRQVELGTPAARPLSFEAVLSQARSRTTSDVRVAERALVIVPPSKDPALDYSAWPTGGTKKVVLSGEFWPDPASAFAGSGSVGDASYTKTAVYPGTQGEACTFTITVTDNRVPDPQAAPPQQAVSYSIPAQLPLGIGQNKEGILPIASVSASGGWDVEAGTLTVSLMPGQSTTVTATGTCLQNGLGKHILATNVGPQVEQFEVEPGGPILAIRRAGDPPTWSAITYPSIQTAEGWFVGESAFESFALVTIRVRLEPTGYVFDNVLARNILFSAGTPSTNPGTDPTWRLSAPRTDCVVTKSENWGWVISAIKPKSKKVSGTFVAPWFRNQFDSVTINGTNPPQIVSVVNRFGDIRGVGTRACTIAKVDEEWVLIDAAVDPSGILKGTFTAPWAKGQTKTVNTEGAGEVEVQNFFGRIGGEGAKTCAVANLNESGWVLIASEC